MIKDTKMPKATAGDAKSAAIANPFPHRPDYWDYCRWFWHHSKKLHGVPAADFAPSREAALRLFECFSIGRFESEDEAIHSMRLDREGTLSLSAATSSKASRALVESKAAEVFQPTTGDLEWDRNIFENSGAWIFFRRAIDEMQLA